MLPMCDLEISPALTKATEIELRLLVRDLPPSLYKKPLEYERSTPEHHTVVILWLPWLDTVGLGLCL